MIIVKLIATFLVLALAVSNQIEAANDLSNLCERLHDTHTQGGLYIQKDTERFFNFARRQLVRLGNFGDMVEVSHLREAWDHALHRKGCDVNALRDVAYIARCNPERFESLATLSEAARRFARECLTPTYVEARIVAETEGGGCLLSGCFKGSKASEMVNYLFIRDYYEANPQDQWLDLEAIKSEKSISAVAWSAIRDVQARSADLLKEFLISSDVEKYLTKSLHKPCRSYVKAADKVMNRIFDTGRFFEGGLSALLSSLNQETQEAVFRYTLCKDFKRVNSKEFATAVDRRITHLRVKHKL